MLSGYDQCRAAPSRYPPPSPTPKSANGMSTDARREGVAVPAEAGTATPESGSSQRGGYIPEGFISRW